MQVLLVFSVASIHLGRWEPSAYESTGKDGEYQQYRGKSDLPYVAFNATTPISGKYYSQGYESDDGSCDIRGNRDPATPAKQAHDS